MGSIRDAMLRAWVSLESGSAGKREWRALRIETEHPLDVFAAIHETSMTRGVLFECPISSAPSWRLRFESEGLRLIDDREGRNGMLRIALALERTDLESVFLVIAEDLIAASRAASAAAEAVGALGSRLSAWQRCLERRREGLGQERMLGLFGELVLLDQLALAIGLDHAVSVWTGPERGLHDFEAGRLAVEVKTCLGTRGAVRVGSLEQLDPSGFQELVLCRVVVVLDPSGSTLPELVMKMRKEADGIGSAARRNLDYKLLMSGYIDAENHEEQSDRLAIVALEGYEVRDTFPRLTRETVAVGVIGAEYRLDTSAAPQYLMTEEAFRKLLARFGVGG